MNFNMFPTELRKAVLESISLEWDTYYDSVAGQKVDESIARQMHGDDGDMSYFNFADVEVMLQIAHNVLQGYPEINLKELR